MALELVSADGRGGEAQQQNCYKIAQPSELTSHAPPPAPCPRLHLWRFLLRYRRRSSRPTLRGSLQRRMTMLMPSQHASQAFHLQRSRTIFNVVCIPLGLQARCVYGSCPIRVTADEPLQRDLLTTWARPLVVMAAGRWRARAHDGGSDMEPSMLTTMVAAVAAAASALAAAMDRSLSRKKACCTVRCALASTVHGPSSVLGAACLLFCVFLLG